MALLSLEAVRDGVRTDPSFHLHNLDLVRQAILVLQLDEAAIRAASFLDDRILTPQSMGRWTPIAEVARVQSPPAPERPVHYIFHTGHVGSTLVSRLLDGVDGVLGLREPLPLRVLAAALPDLGAPHDLLGREAWRTLRDIHLAAWGRGYAQTRAVTVKATSSAGACCAPLLEARDASRAVCLSLKPEAYLATLLGGEKSAIDLRGQAQDRMKRLKQRTGARLRPLHALSLGEIAALSWWVETLAHADARRAFADRVLPIDFDDFLDAPAATLAAICAHFRLAAPAGRLEALVNGPIMTRYSKAPEHAYTPDLRRQVLAQSRTQNAEEIRKGLAWIDALGRDAPDLADALSA